MQTELLDDNAVTRVMCTGNLNLLDDSVVTYDERVVEWQGFVVISPRAENVVKHSFFCVK